MKTVAWRDFVLSTQLCGVERVPYRAERSGTAAVAALSGVSAPSISVMEEKREVGAGDNLDAGAVGFDLEVLLGGGDEIKI